MKQKLDEHLVEVAANALKTAHLLPAFEKVPPFTNDVRSLKRKSPSDFKWQDITVEKSRSGLRASGTSGRGTK